MENDSISPPGAFNDTNNLLQSGPTANNITITDASPISFQSILEEPIIQPTMSGTSSLSISTNTNSNAPNDTVPTDATRSNNVDPMEEFNRELSPFDMNLSDTNLLSITNNNELTINTTNNNSRSIRNNENSDDGMDIFNNPFEDNTHIDPTSLRSNNTSKSNILLMNNENNNNSNVNISKSPLNNDSNDILTPTLNDLLSTRSESPRNIQFRKNKLTNNNQQQQQRTVKKEYPSVNLEDEDSLTTNDNSNDLTDNKNNNNNNVTDEEGISPNGLFPPIDDTFAETFVDNFNPDKFVPLKDAKTDLDQFFNNSNTVTSDKQFSNGADFTIDNQILGNDPDDNFLFSNASLVDNFDDPGRRHSEILINDYNSVPTMAPTSRASISHQFDMWSGLQKKYPNKNNHNNSSNSLQRIASLNSTNNSNNNNNRYPDFDIIKPTPNRQADNNVSNILDGFNLNFSTPFQMDSSKALNPKDDSINDSTGAGLSLTMSNDDLTGLHKTNTHDSATLISPASPKNERRYSIRKVPHRGSVPAIDVEILRRLSTSAGMTPQSNLSSNDGRTMSNNITANSTTNNSTNHATPNTDLKQINLPSNVNNNNDVSTTTTTTSSNTPSTTTTTNTGTNNGSTDNFVINGVNSRMSPDYAGNRFIQSNKGPSRLAFNNTASHVHNNAPKMKTTNNTGSNNNDPQLNASYVSLPQRTARSSSITNLSSGRGQSAYNLPMRAFSPSPSNIASGAFVGRLSPTTKQSPNIPSVSIQQTQQQQQQQQQNLQQQQMMQHTLVPQQIPQMPINPGMNVPVSAPIVNNGISPNQFPTPPPNPQNIIYSNQNLLQGQPIMSVSMQPVPNHVSLQPTQPQMMMNNGVMPAQPMMSMINFGAGSNPMTMISSSTTIVKPNGIIDVKSGVDNSNKSFKCDHCGKAFKRAEHLKRHVSSIHFQERPFECHLCNKMFSRHDNLQQHIKIHEKNALKLHQQNYEY